MNDKISLSKTPIFLLLVIFLLVGCTQKTQVEDETKPIENRKIEKLSNEVKKCSVMDTYGYIFDSYLPNGYEKTLDYGIYYKGSSVVWDDDTEKEYLCYTIDYKQNNRGISFIVPCNEISLNQLNKIISNLINQAVLNVLEDTVQNKYIAIRGVKLDNINSDVNLLNNDYNLNLNSFSWKDIKALDTDITIYASLINTNDNEMLDKYIKNLNKKAKKAGFEHKIIIREY